jgi:hypothetical protein
MEDQVMVSPMSGRYWRNQDESKCCFRNKSATTGSLTKVNANFDESCRHWRWPSSWHGMTTWRRDVLHVSLMTISLKKIITVTSRHTKWTHNKTQVQKGAGVTEERHSTHSHGRQFAPVQFPPNNVYDRRGEVMICVRPKKKIYIYRWTHYY